jgi:hypothetical protein
LSREFTEADTELFNKLWAGTLFNIIHKVMISRPDWDKDEQTALIYMVIEMLAQRWGVIESDEDDET